MSTHPRSSRNQARHTAGLLMLAWAVLMTSLLLFSWRVYLHRSEWNWREYPTGLGDTEVYQPFTENDYYLPALSWQGQKEARYRRSVEPLKRDDAAMIRMARETSNRGFVYGDRKGGPRRYLKAAEDRYLEFGDRKYWPAYLPLKPLPDAVPFEPTVK
jgi:hypothetical protein